MTAPSQSGPGAARSSLLTASSSPLTVGVDVGTTSVKLVVADEDGVVVEHRRLPSRLSVGPDGRFEHDAMAGWWENPRAALGQVIAPRRVRAVAVSAMMPSVGAVDPDGRPIGPGLLYGDRRGRAPALSASASPSRAPVGSDPTTSDEMARLAGWAAAQAPGASGYWPAQAVANASLGGEGVIDLASAFAAGPLFSGPGWDEDACARSGLRPGQLPRVAMFGEPIGHLRPGAIGGHTGTLSGEEFGEVVLGAGSVDGLCEQLVAGAIEDGDVLIALGSTLVVWLCVPGWPDEVPGLWRVPHIAAGKAMVGGASNAGGLWADWADRVLRPGAGGGAPSSEVLRPGDVPLWWPWAHGERVPWHDPDLRISLSGADL